MRQLIGPLAILFLLVTLAPPVRAEESPEARFKAASKAWFDGNTDAACAAYEALLGELGTVSDLHYNLGLCAFQQEKLGLAVYHFEKVRRLDGPLAADARTNLDVVWKALMARYKTKIEKGIYRYDTGYGMGYAVFTLLPEKVALALFLVFAIPLLMALFTWTFSPREALTTTGRIAFLSLLLPALLFATLYYGRLAYVSTHHFAVITAPDATLLEGPDSNAPFTPLPEGLEVRVLLRNEQGFYKVQRGDSDIGYVREDQLNVL
jgi:hypothetical protein